MQGHGIVFATPGEIDSIFSIHIPALKEKLVNSKSTNEFVITIAQIFNLINYAHPFREGNGRTTRIFMEQMVNEFGQSLRLDNLSEYNQQEWYVSCNSAFSGDLRPLAIFFQDQIMSNDASEVLNHFVASWQQENLSEQEFKQLYDSMKDKLRNLSEESILNIKNNLFDTFSLSSKKVSDKNLES